MAEKIAPLARMKLSMSTSLRDTSLPVSDSSGSASTNLPIPWASRRIRLPSRTNRPLALMMPQRNSSEIRSMIPLPQMPTHFCPSSPIIDRAGSMVALSMVTASTAPSVARIPQEMSPPSKAGPAEQAQDMRKSRLPKTISPLVPRSINRLISSLSQIPEARVPAVISPPT